jgi:hypothetical protein
MQLVELGRQHSLTRKLGMDMLRERCMHHDYVAVLLQEGYYLEALRYARKYKVCIRCITIIDACVLLLSSFHCSVHMSEHAVLADLSIIFYVVAT